MTALLDGWFFRYIATPILCVAVTVIVRRLGKPDLIFVDADGRVRRTFRLVEREDCAVGADLLVVSMFAALALLVSTAAEQTRLSRPNPADLVRGASELAQQERFALLADRQSTLALVFAFTLVAAAAVALLVRSHGYSVQPATTGSDNATMRYEITWGVGVVLPLAVGIFAVILVAWAAQ